MTKTNQKYNVIVVEDNPTDKEDLFIEIENNFSEIINVDEIKWFETKEEAKEGVLNYAVKEWVDLVLLDIELQGDKLGGYKVIDHVLDKIGEIPFSIIIMTAYHEPAIEWGKRTRKHPQFLAYVVKGFYQGKDLVEQLRDALNTLKQEIITVPTRGMGEKYPGIRFIPAHNIYFVKADNNYSYVHLSEEVIASSKKLGDFIEELPIEDFLRVHRGYYVNLRQVEEVLPSGVLLPTDENGPETKPKGGVLTLKNGEKIPIPNIEKRNEIEDWMKRSQ